MHIVDTDPPAPGVADQRPALFVAASNPAPRALSGQPAEAGPRTPAVRLVLSLETSLHVRPAELDMGLGSRLQAFASYGGR